MPDLRVLPTPPGGCFGAQLKATFSTRRAIFRVATTADKSPHDDGTLTLYPRRRRRRLLPELSSPATSLPPPPPPPPPPAAAATRLLPAQSTRRLIASQPDSLSPGS